MHPILAENLNGWLFAAALFFGGLLASILALVALVPAAQRDRARTLALAAPALVVGLLVTLWVGYGFITEGMHDPSYSIRDFLTPWLMLAGPPLASGLLAVAVLWVRTKRPSA
jgi:hypothetical protein